MFECKKIPTTLIVNYHIFPYLYRASLKAAYLFDFDAQEFVNAVSLAKQPFVTRGASDAVQSSDPAFTSDKVYKISNGQYLQVGEIDYIWATPENLYVVTHVLKVKFLALPTAPAKEPFYTFISDKTLEIKLTSDKRFDVGTGSLRFITPSYNFNVNQWYFFRIVYSRQYYDELLFHCSIEIEILGIGSNGGYIQCKDLFFIFLGVYLPTNNGGAFRWLSSKLGGSNVAGGTMEFEVESLFAYKGAARLIDTQVETNCAGVAAGSDPCRIYSTHSMRKTCLHCHSPDGSIKWVFRSDSQQADCDASFLGPTLAPASRARFTNTYDSCQKGQRVSSGACVACPSACISCSGTNCVGCSWVNRKLPVGSACGGVCPGTKYYYFGDCYPCASACDGGGGCLKGICTFPTGISVNIYGSNCDLTDKHFTAPGAGCGGCAGNCDICFGTQNDNCYTCPSGRALNIDDNTCLGSCDPTNSKYVDASGLCKTCPTNCQSCLGSSFCTDCKAGFYLNGKSCTTCDTANGYYLNTGNTPKTCDACSPGCKQCSSATSCTTCDTGAGWTPVGAYCCPSNCGACTNGVCTSCNTGAGYYVSGGTCSSCAITNGKFIPPSGDACSNCETGCKECTDQNTCTKCDATGNLYLSSGDCLACDLTNGKFIPPTRNACSNCESNCKECTDQNTCTKCDTANGYYLDSSNCLSCSINIGKYIDLAANPQTCNNCISNCKQCPDGTTCTTCQPNYIKSADSQTCSFCNPVGNYIHTGTTPNQCKPCIQGCLTCSDSTTCSVCDTANNYSLGSGNQCLLPQTSQPTQQNQPNQPNQPSQPNQPNSSNCHQTCKACEGYGILDCRQLLLKQLYHPSWNL